MLNAKEGNIYSITDDIFANYIVVCLNEITKEYIILGPYILMADYKDILYEYNQYNLTIDEINILEASRLAMKLAIENLNIKPEHVLSDAMKLTNIDIPYTDIIHGDALSLSIAAASVIAKVTRDRMMIELDKEYPEYGFAKHKGYGTAEHIRIIKENGPCSIHRRSFIKNFVK